MEQAKGVDKVSSFATNGIGTRIVNSFMIALLII